MPCICEMTAWYVKSTLVGRSRLVFHSRFAGAGLARTGSADAALWHGRWHRDSSCDGAREARAQSPCSPLGRQGMWKRYVRGMRRPHCLHAVASLPARDADNRRGAGARHWQQRDHMDVLWVPADLGDIGRAVVG